MDAISVSERDFIVTLGTYLVLVSQDVFKSLLHSRAPHDQPRPVWPDLSIHSLVILDCSLVTIGDRVMFGPFVSIFTATHETEIQSRRDNVEYAREITIGDDCWIGGHVTILPGVSIGAGCTIGANSIVTKDIPPFSVAMGNPARVVKKVKEVPMGKDVEAKLEEGKERTG